MEEFSAIIHHNPENGRCWVEVPFDVQELFGQGRPKVKVVFDKKVEYRGSLVRMGNSGHILGVRRDIREKLDKHPGDVIHVALEKDLQPREVTIPMELDLELEKNTQAKNYFDSLSYTHRKEYAMHVAEAKKPETRERRAQKTIEMLLKQQKEKG